MIKPAFLLKLAFTFHATDCSIYCVLKLELRDYLAAGSYH